MFKGCNNKMAMSLCKGRDSLLIPYTDTLLSFIFELRETGIPVSTTMVLLKAAQVCHDFCEKTREAQVSITNWYPFIPMSTRRDSGEALDFIITTQSFLFRIAICHVIHLTFFLRRSGFSNKQWTRNDNSNGNTTVSIMFLMLGWAVRVSCVDLHDLSKHSFEFLPVLHMVSQ